MARTANKALSNIRHIKYRVPVSELVAAATSVTIPVAKLPAGSEVLACFADLVTAFTSGSLTNVTVKIGTSGDDDGYLAASELLAGPAATGRRCARGAWVTGSNATINAIFAATGGNFGDGTASNLTAGAVDIHVAYVIVK